MWIFVHGGKYSLWFCHILRVVRILLERHTLLCEYSIHFDFVYSRWQHAEFSIFFLMATLMTWIQNEFFTNAPQHKNANIANFV